MALPNIPHNYCLLYLFLFYLFYVGMCIARAMAYVANVANTIIFSHPESFGDCKRETFNNIILQVFAGDGRVKGKKPYNV